MEEFLKQKPISFERVEPLPAPWNSKEVDEEDLEMKWYEQAKKEDWEIDTEPPSPKDIPLESSAAAASASSGIARALDTLVAAASADQKWEPPRSDEEDVEKQRKEMLAAIKGKLRPGVDRHSDDGGWASRKELRSKGHGKGSRPRGGGPRAQWMTKWHRLKTQGIKWADFVKANPEPPR